MNLLFLVLGLHATFSFSEFRAIDEYEKSSWVVPIFKNIEEVCSGKTTQAQALESSQNEKNDDSSKWLVGSGVVCLLLLGSLGVIMIKRIKRKDDLSDVDSQQDDCDENDSSKKSELSLIPSDAPQKTTPVGETIDSQDSVPKPTQEIDTDSSGESPLPVASELAPQLNVATKDGYYPLLLTGDVGSKLIKLNMTVGREFLSAISSEAKYASKHQFSLGFDKQRQCWLISQGLGTVVNLTAVNGKSIESATALEMGDEICLISQNSGRTAMKISVSADSVKEG